MKLNTYKNQTEIEKTFEVDAYDLMYGTIEDIFDVLDGLETVQSNGEVLKAINANRGKLNDLLLDVFLDMTREDLRKIKVKDLVPFFVELFAYVTDSFGEAEKN